MAESLKQEWTVDESNLGIKPERIVRIINGKEEVVIPWSGYFMRDCYQKICDAHNAALVAERQLRPAVTVEMFLKERQQLAAERQNNQQWQQPPHAVAKALNELKQELATERESNRGLYIESNERYQQLLSALAAIEKHNKECPDECYEIVL